MAFSSSLILWLMGAAWALPSNGVASPAGAADCPESPPRREGVNNHLVGIEEGQDHLAVFWDPLLDPPETFEVTFQVWYEIDLNGCTYPIEVDLGITEALAATRPVPRFRNGRLEIPETLLHQALKALPGHMSGAAREHAAFAHDFDRNQKPIYLCDLERCAEDLAERAAAKVERASGSGSLEVVVSDPSSGDQGWVAVPVDVSQSVAGMYRQGAYVQAAAMAYAYRYASWEMHRQRVGSVLRPTEGLSAPCRAEVLGGGGVEARFDLERLGAIRAAVGMERATYAFQCMDAAPCIQVLVGGNDIAASDFGVYGSDNSAQSVSRLGTLLDLARETCVAHHGVLDPAPGNR
ncbi:MAG: hypothetical protein JRI25_18135 [Deltaproteobacteria bacterium]|nr:hypothetical protein [Deltaproteobacteria bacterium]MBW2256496.1 hypothetical protein [Deltaproteobacteria bacterium]